MRPQNDKPTDTTLAMDPYYRFPVPHPRLIRITGGTRAYSSGKITTFYSWINVYHPQDVEVTSKPIDVSPAVASGPKNADASSEWPALEASGSDTVPTDGSVVVLAWPSPSQDYLIFHYAPEILARIVGRYTTHSTTWYAWQEVEPGERLIPGHDFTDKVTGPGLSGDGEDGIIKNPLFEINQIPNIAVNTIVRVFRYPVRQDPTSDGGYLRERPEAEITVDQAADGSVLSTIQRVRWRGTLGGSFVLKITSPNGVADESNAIDFADDAATIQAAINAASNVTDCEVVGDGEDFTIEFVDDFEEWPFVEVVNADMWSDTPYFFDAQRPNVGYTGSVTRYRSYMIGCNVYNQTSVEVYANGLLKEVGPWT